MVTLADITGAGFHSFFDAYKFIKAVDKLSAENITIDTPTGEKKVVPIIEIISGAMAEILPLLPTQKTVEELHLAIEETPSRTDSYHNILSRIPTKD